MSSTATAQPASTAITAPPTPSQLQTTELPSTPTVEVTVAPIATATPLVLQAIQPLQQTEIIDSPMRGVQAVTDGTRKYSIAAWSPRGRFAAATPQDGPGIDVVDLETGAVTPLITATYVLEPRWTLNGMLIIHRIEAGKDALSLYDPETGSFGAPLITSTPLSAPDVNEHMLVFNRDGEVIVCTAPCTTEDHVVPGGALVAALAPKSAPMLAWNPLVQNLEDVQTLVVSLDSADVAVQAVSQPGEGLWLPRWSPDATRLVLTSVEGRLVVVDVMSGARVDLGPGDTPAWSPDGTTIAYAGASAGLDYTTRDIHIVSADGSGKRERLTDANDAQLYVSPSWSPDGRQVVCVELDSGQLFVGTVPGR